MMRFPIFVQRVGHGVSGLLAAVSQRLPFVQQLVPFLGSPVTLRLATPLTVSFAGTHTLPGQTTFVAPLNGFVEPAVTRVGEAFTWKFNVQGLHSARSYDVQGLPEGLTYTFGLPEVNGLAGGQLTGVVEEEGIYGVTIVGYRAPNLGRESTPTYSLMIVVEGEEEDPFVVWREENWDAGEAADDAVSGPNADPDGDGMENLLEYTLGLDPNEAGVLPGELGEDPDEVGMLLWEIPYLGTGVLVFEENDGLEEDGWTEIPEGQVEVQANTVQLRVSSGGGKKFLRMKALLE